MFPQNECFFPKYSVIMSRRKQARPSRHLELCEEDGGPNPLTTVNPSNKGLFALHFLTVCS